MRKNFFTVFLMLIMSVVAYAQKGTMTINGKSAEYQIEKQYRIGPGAVYTKYIFDNIAPVSAKMVVNVIEIDQTNGYVKQAPYLANGTYKGNNRQIDEHKRQQSLGQKPLASVMGNPFTQETTGTELMPEWSVVGGLAINGAICHSYSGLSYYIDGSNNACIGNLTMSTSISSNGSSINIGNINRVRSNSLLPTLFCNGFGKSCDIAAYNSAGAEAILKLDNTNIIGAGSTTATVTEKKNGSGNLFGEGYAIISGRDGDAYNFVNGLSVGDKVTISVSCTDEGGRNVDLKQLACPLFGYGVRGGVAQPSSMAGYAQCAVGVSSDGKKSYWLEMDNVPGVSDASVDVMNQFMQQLGIYDALLMDGGPSAEMQVGGEWVSVNSLGFGFNGRSIPSALMLYSTVPGNDYDIAEVAFVKKEDFVKINIPYTPEFYAYNQYGEYLAVSAKDSYYLEFKGDCGAVSDDKKSFVATSAGEGELVAYVNGTSTPSSTMHIVVSDIIGVAIEPSKFYTSEGRGAQATLYLKYADGSKKPVNNSDVYWLTEDKWVAECDNGKITPKQDGETKIVGHYDEMHGVCEVTVKTVESDVIDITPLVTDVNNMNIVLDGTPKSAVAVVTPKKDGVAYFTYKNAAGEEFGNTLEMCYAGVDKELTRTFRYDDVDTYPVTLSYLNIGMSLDPNSLELKSLKVYYGDASGITSPDSKELPVSVVRDMAGNLRVTVTDGNGMAVKCDVYTFDGRLVGALSSSDREFVVPAHVDRNTAVIACVTLSGKKYIFKIR